MESTISIYGTFCNYEENLWGFLLSILESFYTGRGSINMHVILYQEIFLCRSNTHIGIEVSCHCYDEFLHQNNAGHSQGNHCWDSESVFQCNQRHWKDMLVIDVDSWQHLHVHANFWPVWVMEINNFKQKMDWSIRSWGSSHNVLPSRQHQDGGGW